MNVRYPAGMGLSKQLSVRDRKLVQIVDSALSDAAERSGSWLKCRPGCTQCCIGPFPINQLDAARLRQGLSELEFRDPERAQRVRERARDAVETLSPEFPGDAVTGVLDETEEAAERFDAFANDEPCPALDPESGTCDLYAARPMTCRVFGPPVRSEGGLGVCELCFEGATAEEIAACQLRVDVEKLEGPLVKAIERADGHRANTIVAFCLR